MKHSKMQTLPTVVSPAAHHASHAAAQASVGAAHTGQPSMLVAYLQCAALLNACSADETAYLSAVRD